MSTVTINPRLVSGYNDAAFLQVEGGQIEDAPPGTWVCRMCRQLGDMPGYVYRSGARRHYFGLHATCARAYFARRKIEDWGKFWDDVDLVTVTVLPQRHGVFDNA